MGWSSPDGTSSATDDWLGQREQLCCDRALSKRHPSGTCTADLVIRDLLGEVDENESVLADLRPDQVSLRSLAFPLPRNHVRQEKISGRDVHVSDFSAIRGPDCHP